MSGSNKFSERSCEDVVQLLRETPLVWVFAQDENGMFSLAAPVCTQVISGQLSSLVGHVPRSSRLASVSNGKVDALIVAVGANAYISPSWFSRRNQAPTWNYASTQFHTQIKLIDDSEYLDTHLNELVEIMERGRDRPWRIEEMGDRYELLARRIVAFEAKVTSWEGKFKLGQDEPDDTFAEITAALNVSADHKILAWMEEFNSGRKAS